RRSLPYLGLVTTAESCVMPSCPRFASRTNRNGGSTAKGQGPPRQSTGSSAPFEPNPSPPGGTDGRSFRRLRCSPGQRPRRHRRRHLYVDEAKLPSTFLPIAYTFLV